ncbi:hypothetical protein [Salibacterium aidingense]|uniref:hypothetical protein n=1 Tax=Salibacterium aidingense TaxID=384933 RepID=UPI0003F9A385|nr:hypothetical protein [Salibacterium aidingense]
MLSQFKQWITEEEGFQVFEKFGLTQGGVLLALIVTSVTVVIMSGFWNDVGSRYFSTGTGIDGMAEPGNAESMGWADDAQTGWD